MASALRVEQARPALEAAARLRDILGPDNFFLEMQYQGIEEQKVVNNGTRAARARARTCRSSRTNDVHYLRQGDYQPHDILLCIGTGKTVNDEQRLRYTGDQFFLKTAEQMAERLQRTMPTRCRTRCSSPSAATSRSRRAEPPADRSACPRA